MSIKLKGGTGHYKGYYISDLGGGNHAVYKNGERQFGTGSSLEQIQKWIDAKEGTQTAAYQNGRARGEAYLNVTAPSLGLWKYNKITGYWVPVRSVTEETGKAWLDIFQRDEPGESFKLSIHKPSGAPK